MSAVTKAWTGDNRTAYDRVDDLERIAEGYKRCRSAKFFIASDEALERTATDCSVCGKRVEPRCADDEYSGNRGIYHPRSKRYVVAHYVCSWTDLLGRIAEHGRRVA
jgi:hypothetical protein